MDNILQALVEIFIILVGFVFVFVGIMSLKDDQTAFSNILFAYVPAIIMLTALVIGLPRQENYYYAHTLLTICYFYSAYKFFSIKIISLSLLNIALGIHIFPFVVQYTRSSWVFIDIIYALLFMFSIVYAGKTLRQRK
jgi:hypothetical protein